MTTATTKYWGLLAAVALLQIGFLAKMVFDRVALIKSGREIALQVIPIDPRDVFRGEYVILGYDISQIPAPIAEDRDDRFARGQTVYVTLQQAADGAWTAKSVSTNYPSEGAASEVVLKGTVRNRVHRDAAGGTAVAVRYGIESYFVPEGAGKALEQGVRDKKIQALVAVGADGTPALKGLVIGGERHEDPPML
ncbi:MAG TPA: GDYXXLXY domain-containing protein [Hyphomicrobium sp.]|nr:GDYXXLXY domain-containing protein [Hyphomicrobium sp.]